MFFVDRLILIGAVLLLLGIVSSKFSARFGVPVLVLFLAVGMLAGSEGIGGIDFENYPLAHGLGTLALAVILFDGGLRTSLDSFRLAWKPALSLATAGVLLSAGITGMTAAWLLGFSPLAGLLLGSIVGSTDAAAVFSILRSHGLRLPPRVAATLEVESGSNDPMAVFLTVALLQLLLGQVEPGPALLGMFVLQMGVGAVVGVAAGWLGTRLVNRIDLAAAGLYPILAGGCGLLAYGAAASLGGSGFLAVYLAGIVMGNGGIVFQRGVLLFHDGIAWLAQIAMFVTLGLLSFPSRLADAAVPGLLTALVLVFLARPVGVVVSLLPFGFGAREMAFISWAGVRGAVPIILATYPLLLGLPQSDTVFNVVFFAVVVSTLAQGSTLPWVARRLGLQLPPEPRAPVTLEITSLRHTDGDIVEYAVTADSRAAGRRIRELTLPQSAVVAMIAREHEIIPARGRTLLLAGDHVFLVLRRDARAATDRVFGSVGDRVPGLPAEVEFPLSAAATVDDLVEFYGVHIDAPGDERLGDVLHRRLAGEVREGARLELDGCTLVVRALLDGGVDEVGILIRAPEQEPNSADAPRIPPEPS